MTGRLKTFDRKNQPEVLRCIHGSLDRSGEKQTREKRRDGRSAVGIHMELNESGKHGGGLELVRRVG